MTTQINTEVTFTNITNWLTQLGYSPVYHNTPALGTKEFQFSKNGSRVSVYFPQQGTVHCKMFTSVFGNRRFKDFTISSAEFRPLDTNTLNRLYKEQQGIRKEMSTSPQRKIDTKQTYWEIWLYISLLLFIVGFIIGMLDHSREQFPNWPYFFVFTILNFIACIWVGRTNGS